MISIQIQKKDLWLLAAIMVFLVGVGYVIAYNPSGTGIPSIHGHTANEIEGGVGGGQTWESDWIAVSAKKVYANGGTDAAGNTINLNHNLGKSSLFIQVLYAKEIGTFPTSPNLNTITYNTAHSDSNIDWRSVHGGVLVQGINNNSIDKLVTGHENVAIWADSPVSWNSMRESSGWIKILATTG